MQNNGIRYQRLANKKRGVKKSLGGVRYLSDHRKKRSPMANTGRVERKVDEGKKQVPHEPGGGMRVKSCRLGEAWDGRRVRRTAGKSLQSFREWDSKAGLEEQRYDVHK